jgi:hypothetical protein
MNCVICCRTPGAAAEPSQGQCIIMVRHGTVWKVVGHVSSRWEQRIEMVRLGNVWCAAGDVAQPMRANGSSRQGQEEGKLHRPR